MGLRKDREGCEILTTSKTEIQDWLLDSCIRTHESLCVIKVGPRNFDFEISSAFENLVPLKQ